MPMQATLATPELGDRVKYGLNGFTGIVTARTERLDGTVRIEVTSETLPKDGSWIEPVWFYATEVEMVQKSKTASG